MAIHCQKAMQSLSGELQNLEVVNSFEGKKKMGGQLQSENLIRVVTCKMCSLSLYFAKYIIFITRNHLWNNSSHFCI